MKNPANATHRNRNELTRHRRQHLPRRVRSYPLQHEGCEFVGLTVAHNDVVHTALQLEPHALREVQDLLHHDELAVNRRLELPREGVELMENNFNRPNYNHILNSIILVKYSVI